MNSPRESAQPIASEARRAQYDKRDRASGRLKRAVGVTVCAMVLLEGAAYATTLVKDTANPHQELATTVEKKLQEHLVWENPQVRCHDDLIASEATAGEVYWYHVPFTWNFVPGQIVHMDSKICNNIASLPSLSEASTYGITDDQANALVIAVHERKHGEGEMDEVYVECVARQEVPAELRYRGYPTEIVSQKAEASRNNYHGLPADYKSEECKFEGKYDLSQEDFDRYSALWLDIP